MCSHSFVHFGFSLLYFSPLVILARSQIAAVLVKLKEQHVHVLLKPSSPNTSKNPVLFLFEDTWFFSNLQIKTPTRRCIHACSKTSQAVYAVAVKQQHEEQCWCSLRWGSSEPPRVLKTCCLSGAARPNSQRVSAAHELLIQADLSAWCACCHGGCGLPLCQQREPMGRWSLRRKVLQPNIVCCIFC